MNWKLYLIFTFINPKLWDPVDNMPSGQHSSRHSAGGQTDDKKSFSHYMCFWFVYVMSIKLFTISLFHLVSAMWKMHYPLQITIYNCLCYFQRYAAVWGQIYIIAKVLSPHFNCYTCGVIVSSELLYVFKAYVFLRIVIIIINVLEACSSKELF